MRVYSEPCDIIGDVLDKPSMPMVVTLIRPITKLDGKITQTLVCENKKATVEKMYNFLDALKVVDSEGQLHMISMNNIAGISYGTVKERNPNE